MMLLSQYLAKSTGKTWEKTFIERASELIFCLFRSFLCLLWCLVTCSCDRETTFCLATESDTSSDSSSSSSPLSSSQLFIPRPKYACLCRDGFYVPNETFQGFTSDKIESDGSNFTCIPCPTGCSCDRNGMCIYGTDEEDDFLTESVLRASIGAILGCCILCCFLIGLTVFRRRKCKVSLTWFIDMTRIACFYHTYEEFSFIYEFHWIFTWWPLWSIRRSENCREN